MTGQCCICGAIGELSYEHIPPKAAFNNSPVIYMEGEDAIKYGPNDIIKGKVLQRGYGKYSLCYKCNNNTGAWYASHFVKWCHWGMDVLIRSSGKPTLIYTSNIIPLRVIKQIIAIFFSVNGNQFGPANTELVEFVLNRERKYLSSKYKIFCYYNWEGGYRSTGLSVIGNTAGRKPIVLSEFSFAPYGYVLCLDSIPPDNRLFEITHFSRYGYNELASIALEMKVLPTFLALPGDYRTKEEIIDAYNRNMRIDNTN